MDWSEVFAALGCTIASRAQLRECGASDRLLTSAVRARQLLRVRRDHYAVPGTSVDILQAVRIGGRLGCVSALRHFGVFALQPDFVHVHVERAASRCRSPRDRLVALRDHPRDGVTLHWAGSIDEAHPHSVATSLCDALSQAVRCQSAWLAVASLDNALHTGLIGRDDLGRIFAGLPERFGYIRALLDSRSEAGQESVLRMIVQEAGLNYELQVYIAGVGRVDMVVEGCVIVEADSRLAHHGWELHVRDRDRDLAAARAGYASLRPVFQRIMFTPMDVRDAILGLLEANRHFTLTR